MRLTVRCSRAALCVDRLSQAALAASLQDARAAGLAFGVDAAELEQKLDEAEEADLKMAMALSMQLEEERERMAIEGREIPLQLAPIDSCQTAQPQPPSLAGPPAPPPPAFVRPGGGGAGRDPEHPCPH